ncbi:MAG TPA: alpha/beta fold hydrolase [Solirubrobacteraceae bacterium]|nr:alpha/beta fold hydrolase [Solirubrobacteraceae bacterium]
MDAAFTAQHRGGAGEPLVLIHGFTDTWRTWELVLPALEARHDVLAVTLPGHAGGPAIDGDLSDDTLAVAVERAMDGAGFDTAHLVGNSLGGYTALRLAARGRARTVVALAPAGGWAKGDDSYRDTLQHFITTQDLVKTAAPHAEAIVASPEGRRRATEFITTHHEHIPPALIAHQIRGAAGCVAARELIAYALAHGWALDAELVTCPARFIWGTADRLLPWPRAAVGYRQALPTADWVLLDDIGHCPQLDVPLETAQLILGFTGG